MSRSIHKTIRQIVQDNTKADLNDPENPDLIEYVKKLRYKAEERQARRNRKAEDEIEADQ